MDDFPKLDVDDLYDPTQTPGRTKLKRCTPKQEAFCLEYMKDFSPPLAYVRAGFKGANAASNAYRLMKNPQVIAKIDELKGERANENRLTLEKVRDSLQSIAIAAEDEGRFGAAIRAWELLGKYFGMFTERAQLEIMVNKSPEELDSEIARLTKLVKTDE